MLLASDFRCKYVATCYLLIFFCGTRKIEENNRQAYNFYELGNKIINSVFYYKHDGLCSYIKKLSSLIFIIGL